MNEKFRYLIVYLDGSLPPVGTNDLKVAQTANEDDSFGVIDRENCTILASKSSGYQDLPIKEQTIYTGL